MSKRIPLEGKKFGKLYVVKYIGNSKYLCQCDCGNKCTVYSQNLIRNHTTSCGCNKLISDLKGKIFGYLEVIERSDSRKRGNTKRVQWKCRCQKCGKIIAVYADSLLSGSTISCGCLQHNKDMPQAIKDDFINGTQISKLMMQPTKANKSGVVGVNWDKSRGKWQASIRFQGHKYNLGRFDDFNLACKVRKDAENAIFGDFLNWYNQNKD